MYLFPLFLFHILLFLWLYFNYQTCFLQIILLKFYLILNEKEIKEFLLFTL